MDLTIKQKIAGLVILALISVGGFALLVEIESQAVETSIDLQVKRTEELAVLERAVPTMLQVVPAALHAILNRHEGEIAADIQADLAESMKALETARDGLTASADTEDERKVAAEFARYLPPLLKLVRDDLPTHVKAKAGDEIFNRLDDQIVTAAGRLRDAIEKYLDLLRRDQGEAVVLQHAMVAREDANVRIGAVIAFVLMLVFGVLVMRSVVEPLRAIGSAVADVARDRDFRIRIAYDHSDEIGAAARDLNGLFSELQAALAGVLNNTRQVANSSGQASSAIGQVADGAQSQLNALRQIATAVKQSAAAIQDVALSTNEANQQTKEAVSLVQAGREGMSAMVLLVRSISENSAKINQITEVIARIANQTNMLSLNAAIEAARAGEHGKGFAVVAEEVRRLAEDVASSVKDISHIVESADREARKGVDVTATVNNHMEKIDGAFAQVQRVIGTITSAMNEQQAMTSEIRANVDSLSKISESNASAAEEITATMVELSRLADQTRLEVEKFKVS